MLFRVQIPMDSEKELVILFQFALVLVDRLLETCAEEVNRYQQDSQDARKHSWIPPS